MELRILNQTEITSQKLLLSTSDYRQLLKSYQDYYQKFGFHLPWVAYLIILENKVVGTCSFIGEPKDGKVEIAYNIFKDFEGKGIVSFGCQELISITKKIDPTINIITKTAPKVNKAIKNLRKNGFIFTEIVKDHKIGDAWLWTLKGLY